MVQHCCAYGCKNQWQSHGKIRFHRFPLKQPEILKLWLQAIRRENFYPTSTTVICSDHFTPDSYLESSLNKRLLKKGAVPSIFCFDSHVKKHVPRRQITKHILQEVSTSNQILSNMEVDEASFKNVSTQTSPRKIKKSNNEVLASRKIKILQQRLKRREKSIKNMKDLMKYLREQKATDLQDTLNNYFEGFSLELFQHASKNLKVVPTQRRYSDEMKRFALTLYFYSPKAYNYVRSNIALPHISMLRKWLSSRNCDVGILSEVMEFLKTKATEQEYLRNVALVFDSMSIRSQLTYDRSLDKHIGYVDLGGISNTDSEELATEALIFQIVSYKHKFKCPVAYFFINKISGQLQSQLLLQIIESLYNIGVTVRSITCDGSHANVKTIRELGCTLLSENLMPSFKHPLNHSNIYFILDACHMLKLCRNAFAETSLSSPRGLISFKYIEELHKLQELEDLKLANSLSGPHIYYMQKKMNVRLAAQTISSSVADAIDYLRKSGNLTFADSEATTEFIRYFDRIFDIMNSRTLFGKGYKAPLSLNNQEYWLNIFVETENYIKQLKIGETNILQHSRKTFALGFLINIYSFKHLTFDLLKNISSPLQYFLTYKCSQDHLELFFSCIRSRGGWNNNPNCQQFRWALRKLLFHNSVQPSINANCVDSNSEAITIFEFRSPKRSVEEKTNKDEINDSVTSLMRMVDNINLSFIQENILYYIGGFIIKKLLRKNLCSFCKRIVLSKYTNEHNYTLDIQKCTSFTNFVSHGKLLNPSLGIYEIIKCTEKSFRTLINLGAIGKSNFKQNIVMAVVQYFAPKITTLFHPPHPIVDNGELHELQIIKYVSESYATLRIETHAKKKTLQALGQKATIRQKLTKTILFYHV